MSTKQEVFGVIWIDNAFGPLTLTCATAAEAVAKALSMRKKGEGKIRDCRAVHIAAGSDKLEDL